MDDCGKTPCQDACPDCDYGPFTRNHYFTGKLLVERDFKDEQRYYVDKLRHHQQRLHGWGVVCGLQVTPHENPACRTRFVCIEPGTAIDCCGREILVKERECIDVTRLPGYAALDQAGPQAASRLQICIRYRECGTEEVPVLYDECGCDDTRCAPNRVLESWEADLLVNPPLPAPAPHQPVPSWSNSVAIAHVTQVALHEGTQRLYALNSDGTVFPVRTDNHSVLTPLVPPSPALAIAVSNDGTRLYVAVGPNDRSVLVYDTANLAAAPVQTLAIGASAGSGIELAVAPVTGRLVALANAPGRVLAWQTDINAPGVPANPDDIALSADLRSLAISSDGTLAYAVDRALNRLQVANLAPAGAGTPIAVPPDTLDLYALAIVRTTAPDKIAVVSQAERTLYLVTPGQAAVPQIAVTNRPEAVTISPDGNWAYVVARNGAQAFLEIADLFGLQQNQPAATAPPFPIGNGALPGVITSMGATLYVPWTGDPAVPGDGGVSIVDIEDGECAGIFYRDCLSCETGNCIALATIENYNLGDRFESQTAPPADPIADNAAAIVRIDNRTGRRVLPSTQALMEAIECIRREGGAGTPGPMGPPGAPGQDGQDGTDGTNGLGFDPDLPKILDIGWVHAANLSPMDWSASSFYDAHPNELLTREIPPALAIYFNRPDMRGLDRQTFQVGIRYPQMLRDNVFTGVYNLLNVDLYGYILPLGPRLTPHTGENAPSAFAFVPYREFFLNVVGILTQLWAGQSYQTQFPDLRLDLPAVHVLLKGDFVYAGPVFAENRALDGDNVGGNVGLNILRAGPIQGGRNPSGNLAQGGDFESWFFLSAPAGQTPPGTTLPGTTPPGGLPSPGLLRNNLLSMLTGDATIGVNLSSAPAAELRTLPGVTDAIARRIVRAREGGPFTGLDDFRTRSGLSDEVITAIRNYIVLA